MLEQIEELKKEVKNLKVQAEISANIRAGDLFLLCVTWNLDFTTYILFVTSSHQITNFFPPIFSKNFFQF